MIKAFLLLTIFHILKIGYGWGPIGHSLIVRIAQSRVSEQTKSSLLNIVPFELFGNLSVMASWADNILYPDTNPVDYVNWQWSRPLHYINTPDWNCTFDVNRDCPNGLCVSGAIGNYSERLKTVLDEVQQRQALYFFIHYVGDIHQPLHNGFVSDRGANSIRGHFFNASSLTNLHSLWDVGLMDHRIATDFSWNITSYFEHIQGLASTLAVDEVRDLDVNNWIKENLNYVCNSIYIDENNATMNTSTNFRLGEIYYQQHIDIVEKRLALGGVRLGQLLDQLAKSRPKPPSDGLETVKIVLIVLVCVEGVLLIASIAFIFLRRKSCC